MSPEKFLIDTNSLIAPARNYYQFVFAPSFWRQLSAAISSNDVALLDMVKSEIIKSKKDKLAEWIKNIKPVQCVTCEDKNVMDKYSEILDYIRFQPFYSEEALMEWSVESVADPWLIAAASVHGYTIITFETENRNLNPRYPSKRAKIPDVAKEFNVKTENLFYMMKKLNFKL